MDVLLDDVTELDGALLAALWTRAVIAADLTVLARCETECERRGVRPQALVAACRRPLVAATKKKAEDDHPTTDIVGERRKGPHDYQDIVTQGEKNKREGKSYDTGQATYKTKGYNPYRKKKGPGGGQFTTKEAAETTDPEAARKGAELQEDDERIPQTSPKGAKIKDFRDGMMIYEDGTRYDAKGWRNDKGEALDDKGNVIKKGGSGGDKSGKAALAKAERDAAAAKKKAEKDKSNAWDSAENRRKAEEDAKGGNYSALMSIVTRNEREARKRRDLTDDPTAKAKADTDVAAAQKELADVKDAAAKAKTAQQTAAKAKSTADAAARQKERTAQQTAAQQAAYAEIVKNYPAWEKELRAQYTDVGLSETEMHDLIIRDRARRIRLLPRAVQNVVTSSGLLASGFDGAAIVLLCEGDNEVDYGDGDKAPLHCTIAFLGDAANLAPAARDHILGTCQQIASALDPFDANVVSDATFGDTKVRLVEADDIAQARDIALADPNVGVLSETYDDHPHYMPHVSGLDDRDTVRFDRVAAMLGGDRQVYPLGGPMAAAADFTPDLHPRGKDGKFIEKLGLVDLFGLSGFQHGQRGKKQVQGQVVEILPNPKSPGDPIIRVKVTDPRWDPKAFGETVDVHRNQVAQRQKVKATLPHGIAVEPKAPDIAAPLVPKTTPGPPPPRTPTPNLTPHPDGPHLAPLALPPDWEKMDDPTRISWIADQMNTDLAEWRAGTPADKNIAPAVDLTGFDPGIAFNLANTYRDLVNWDPETAKRIDQAILGNQSMYHDGDLQKGAIAVAHPGTAHPGGIGKKLGLSQIVFGNKYMTGMDFWQKQKQLSDTQDVPWSTSSMTADPTVTLIHEFGHQRQFRYLDIAMRDVGKAWSPAVRDDGFGLVPDSSNWNETQDLRYQIPKLTQTKYGHSKSSEGFAEGVAERALGISSPELDQAYDQWYGYMGVSLGLPADRHAQSRSYDELTPTEKDQFWQANGQYLELPGMREHYPDSAAVYDAWQAKQQGPARQETPVAPAGEWAELEPGAWLMNKPDGWRAVYDRDALDPSKADEYAAKFGDAPYGWQRNINSFVPGVKNSGGVLDGTANSLAQAQAKADKNPAGMDTAIAKYNAGQAAKLAPAPATVSGPGGTIIPLTTLSDETGQFEPGGWANPDTIASVQNGLDRVNASYPKAPPLRTIGIRPDQQALGNKSIDTITVSPAFHDPEVWAQKQKDAWLFAGDGTPAATIFHEYGHIMDGALTAEQRKPLDAIVRAPVTYDVNGQQVTVPRWQSGAAGVANPSAYASESPYEFVAEALTDVEFNGPDAAPVSQEIAAIFQGVFA